ncbi:hypothetical protein BOTBODRAFT_61073 [Botryobasidium botryosum FD-172 SS1]|uniref:Major facilitator superfamily (MFS) profile domain-containing protein n=1 Tax=Botryobasidium botryosum (strain FD-172 SS1) TaxID=930990 RepID=A0A067NB88_BOTB1|nr:hypothetical protein BOTBODRAFT_61073 [Botryobasidium botryosum FD-172 SS1]
MSTTIPPTHPASNLPPEVPIELKDHRSGIPPRVHDIDRGSKPSMASTSPVSRSKFRHDTNTLRMLSALYTATVLGLNDGSLGSQIPLIQQTYFGGNSKSGYGLASLIFLTNTVGYLLAAMCCGSLVLKIDLPRTLVIGAASYTVGYSFLSAAPPFGVLVFGYVFIGFGGGTLNAGLSTYIASFDSTKRMSLFHSMYGVGAVIAPLISIGFTDDHIKFNYYYMILLGLSVINIVQLYFSFRAYSQNAITASATTVSPSMKATLKKKVVWITAVFLLLYVGAEITIGGWIVDYLTTVRHGEPGRMRYVAAGFWGGIALGRFLLAIPTVWLGEKLAVIIYLLVTIAAEFVVWFVPSLIPSAVMLGIIGFALGPLFPASLSLVVHYLPVSYHATAIGFAVSFGFVGAATFPLMTGEIAGVKGVQVLEPIIVALCVGMLCVWLFMPKDTKGERED